MPPLETLERLGDHFALDAPTERKRMLVIVNPYASTVSDRLKNLVVSALQGRYEVDAIDTRHKDDATGLAREASLEGYDVIVAFGGDGTLNEVANGLVGSGTPLVHLPGGRTNVFAKMLGIPGDIVDATEHVLRMADRWAPRKVDLAKVNDRWFTFSSGVGLDASVVARVDAHPKRKAKYGPFYFVACGIGTFNSQYVVRPPRLEVELGDGRTDSGVTALVQNGDPYTYFQNAPIRMCEGAALDSGDLSALVLESSSPTVMPGVIRRAFSKRARIVDHRAVRGFEGLDGLVVRSADERPVPLQVDGDHIGDVLEARYSVAPGALTVVA